MAKKTKKQTHVAIVLDSSGSMSSMREQAIALFNSQRDEVVKSAKKAGEVSLSLVLFGVPDPSGNGNLVSVVHDGVSPSMVPRLDEKTYRPWAMTPMRDAIGRAIGLLDAKDDGGSDTAMLVIVVTDGQENNSREWTAKALSDKIVELQNTNRWTFAVYGCSDLDLAELKDRGGLSFVPDGNIGTYKRGAEGLRRGVVALNAATSGYMATRAGGLTASVSFAETDDDSAKTVTK